MPGLEGRIWFDTTSSAHGLMSDGVSSEQVKKFFFTSRRSREEGEHDESLEIYIPELLQASYSFYTWPSAPVLAWFLWEHREDLVGKRVLELGSGTALPGIVASKCGALVTLSDSASLPKSLQHIKRSCELNGVLSQVKIVGITWGIFLSGLFSVGPLDLILGSDCFYEPSVFEEIIVTVAFLLERNPSAKFLCTYQERSADWSIEHLLSKWGLACTHVSLVGLGEDSGISVHELMQDHTIHLLDIRRNLYRLFVGNLPWTVSGSELKQYFSQFGHISTAKVIFNRDTGMSKHYGFVDVLHKNTFESIINRRIHKLEGKQLMVRSSNE